MFSLASFSNQLVSKQLLAIIEWGWVTCEELCRSRRTEGPRWMTSSGICIILHIIRQPNSIIMFFNILSKYFLVVNKLAYLLEDFLFFLGTAETVVCCFFSCRYWSKSKYHPSRWLNRGQNLFRVPLNNQTYNYQVCRAILASFIVYRIFFQSLGLEIVCNDSPANKLIWQNNGNGLLIHSSEK